MFDFLLWAEEIERYGRSYRSKSEHHIVANTSCQKLMERGRNSRLITEISIPSKQLSFSKKGYTARLFAYAAEPGNNGTIFLLNFEKGTKSIPFRLLSTLDFKDFQKALIGQMIGAYCADIINRYYMVLIEDWFDSIREMPEEVEKIYNQVMAVSPAHNKDIYWDFLIEHIKKEIESEETGPDKDITWRKIETKQPITADVGTRQKRFKLALKKYLTRKLKISTILKNLVGDNKQKPNIKTRKQTGASKVTQIQSNISEKSKKNSRWIALQHFCDRLDDQTQVALTVHSGVLTNMTITHNGQTFDDVCDLMTNDEKRWVVKEYLKSDTDSFHILGIDKIWYLGASAYEKNQKIQQRYQFVKDKNEQFTYVGGIRKAVGYHNLRLVTQAYKTEEQALRKRYDEFQKFCSKLDNSAEVTLIKQGWTLKNIAIIHNGQTRHDFFDLITDTEKLKIDMQWLDPKASNFDILGIINDANYKKLTATERLQSIENAYKNVIQLKASGTGLEGINKAVVLHNARIAKQAYDALYQEEQALKKRQAEFKQFCGKLDDGAEIRLTKQGGILTNITITHNGQARSDFFDLMTDVEKDWIAKEWLDPLGSHLEILKIQDAVEYNWLTVADKRLWINSKYDDIKNENDLCVQYDNGIKKILGRHNLRLLNQARAALLKECDEEAKNEAKKRPEKFKQFCAALNYSVDPRIAVIVNIQNGIPTDITVKNNSSAFPGVCDLITEEEKIWVANNWLDPHGDPFKILKIADEEAYRQLSVAKKREYVNNQYRNDKTSTLNLEGIKKAVVCHNLAVLAKAHKKLLKACDQEQKDRPNKFREFCNGLDDSVRVSITKEYGIVKNITVKHNGQIFDDVYDLFEPYQRGGWILSQWLDPDKRDFNLLNVYWHHVNEDQYKRMSVAEKRQHISNIYQLKEKHACLTLIDSIDPLNKAIGWHNLGIIKHARDALLAECDKEEQILDTRIADNTNHYDILRENGKPRPVKNGNQFVDALDDIWEYYQNQHQNKIQHWQQEKQNWPAHLHHIADHNLRMTDRAWQAIKAEILAALPAGTLGMDTQVRNTHIDEDLKKIHDRYEQKLGEFAVVYRTAEFVNILDTNKINVQIEYNDCMKKVAEGLAIQANTPEEILGMDPERQPQDMLNYIQHCKDHQTEIINKLARQNYAQHDAIQLVLGVNLSKIDDAFNRLSLAWNVRNRLTPENYKKIERIPGLRRTIKLKHQRLQQTAQNWASWHEIRNVWPGHFDFIEVTAEALQNEIDQINQRAAVFRAQKEVLDRIPTATMTQDEKLNLDIQKAECLSSIEPLEWQINQLQALKVIKKFEQVHTRTAQDKLKELNPQYNLNMAFDELADICPEIYNTPAVQTAIQGMRDFLKNPSNSLCLLDYFKQKDEETKKSIDGCGTCAKLMAVIPILRNKIVPNSPEERQELGILTRAERSVQSVRNLLTGFKNLFAAHQDDYRITYLFGRIEMEIIKLLKKKDSHKSIKMYDPNVLGYQNIINEYFQYHTLPNFLLNAQRPGGDISPYVRNIVGIITKDIPSESYGKIFNKLFSEQRAAEIMKTLAPTKYYIDPNTDLEQHLDSLKAMSVQDKLLIFQDMYNTFMAKCGDMYPGEDFNKTGEEEIALNQHRYQQPARNFAPKKLADIIDLKDVFPYTIRIFEVQNKKEKILSLVQMLRVRDAVLQSLDKDHGDFNKSQPSPSTENYIKSLSGHGWAEESLENNNLEILRRISGHYIHIVPPGVKDRITDRRLTDDEIKACKETIFYFPERLLQAYMALYEKNNPEKLKKFFDLMDSKGKCMNYWSNLAITEIQMNMSNPTYRSPTTLSVAYEQPLSFDKLYEKATAMIDPVEENFGLGFEKEQYIERIKTYIKKRYAGKTFNTAINTITLDNEDAFNELEAEIEKKVNALGIYA